MRALLLGLVFTAMMIAPSIADAGQRHRHHHRHHHHMPMTPHGLLGIDYRHNYGPGVQPGTFATYDGRPGALCADSASSYRGQDRRLHPCS